MQWEEKDMDITSNKTFLEFLLRNGDRDRKKMQSEGKGQRQKIVRDIDIRRETER